jgi:hypothetical protein
VHLQDELPALSEDDEFDESMYEWVYVSKELGWVRSLREQLPTPDAHQPDSTQPQLPTQGQDDQFDKPADNSEWKMEGEGGMRSDYQKQPEQPPRDEVDHLEIPKTDPNLTSFSERTPNDANQGENSGISVASQTLERIDVDADQNQQAGNDAPPTATKAPPTSSGSQRDGLDHHHRDRMRMASTHDPNLLGIDMYGIYLRSIGLQRRQHPLDHPSPSARPGGDGKRPNVNALSEKDDRAGNSKVYSLSQLPLNNEQPPRDEVDHLKIPKMDPNLTSFSERTPNDANQGENSGISVASQTLERIDVDADQNQQAGNDAPPTATKAPPTSSGSQHDNLDHHHRDRVGMPSMASRRDPNLLGINVYSIYLRSIGLQPRQRPLGHPSPLARPGGDGKRPNVNALSEKDDRAGKVNSLPQLPLDNERKSDAPPSDTPAGTSNNIPPTRNDTPPSEVSLEYKTCSTEEEAVQPSDFDNATSQSPEAPHFGIIAPPTGHKVPLRNGEQEEEKYKSENNIPDVIDNGTYSLDHPSPSARPGGDGKRPNVNALSEKDDRAGKVYSTEDQPSDFDNATPAPEASHFGIVAPRTGRKVPPPSLRDGEQEEEEKYVTEREVPSPSLHDGEQEEEEKYVTEREVPPPSLRDGEQEEEEKYEPENNIPDVTNDGTYYLSDNVSSAYVDLIIAWGENFLHNLAL